MERGKPKNSQTLAQKNPPSTNTKGSGNTHQPGLKNVENLQTEQQIEKLKKEIKGLTNKMYYTRQGHRQQLATLTSQNQSMKSKLEKYENKLKQMSCKISVLESNEDYYIKHIGVVHAEVVQLEKRLNFKDKKIQKLSDQLQHLTEKLQIQEVRTVNKVIGENQSLKDEILGVGLKTAEISTEMKMEDSAIGLFPKVVGHLFRYLSSQDVRECRRVCKTWKNGIDTELHSLPYCVEYKITFNSSKTILRFMEDMKDPTTCPFPNGYIWIEQNSDEDKDFSWNVRKLLHRFGQYVKELHYDMHKLDLWPVAQLRSVMWHVPNMHHFEASFPDNENDSMPGQMIRDYLKINPFPTLKHLKTVGFRGFKKVMIEELLRSYGNQIEDISSSDCVLNDGIISLPSLKHVGLIGGEDLMLKQIASNQWPLQEIHIVVYETLILEILVDALNSVQGTLRILDIMCNWDYCDLECKDYNVTTNINLPKLETIHLIEFRSYPLDFLLKSKNLKSLNLHHCYLMSQSIFTKRGDDDIASSFDYLWELFPMLENLDLQEWLQLDLKIKKSRAQYDYEVKMKKHKS